MLNKSKEHERAAAARREYQRQWRAKNKHKVAQYNQEYWLRKAEQMEQEGGGKNAHTDEFTNKGSATR